MSEPFITSERRHRRERAGIAVWLIGVLVGSLLAGAFAATFINLTAEVHILSDQVNAQDGRADERDANIETLRDQLQAVGVEPAVPSPEGSSHGNGRDGTDGRDGRAGRDGDTGQDGETITGPAGPAGPPGADGVDGVQGPAGDTVTGPQGPAGDTIIGPQGPTGADGQPVPFEFVAGGVTYTCTPAPDVTPTICTQIGT